MKVKTTPSRLFLALLVGGFTASIGASVFMFVRERLAHRPHTRPVIALAEGASDDHATSSRSAVSIERRPIVSSPIFANVSPEVSREAPPEPPPPHESNEAFTARMLKQLEGSGTTHEGWTSDARQTLNDWQSHAKAPVTFKDLRCFSQGCTATASFTDMNGFEAENTELENATSWPGPRFHSGPTTSPSGTVESVWILYHRPQ